MSYYPPYKSSSNNVKVELDLTNYATKTDLKNITHVDVSSFASKTNLAALKTEVDKIDTDKLKTAPTDLAKLTNAIENDVVKKTDTWCKTGQYLDHKNCVCKNNLIGRLIEECTSTINETMINNKYSSSSNNNYNNNNNNNNNTLRNVFIGLFSVAILTGIIYFCVFAYFRWFKSKKLFKKYIDY